MDDYYSEAEMKVHCRRMMAYANSCVAIDEISCYKCWLANRPSEFCLFDSYRDRNSIAELILRDLAVIHNGELCIVEED